MGTSVILHQNEPLPSPDWAAIRAESPEEAESEVRGILKFLDRSEKQTFAMRGLCVLIAEERELWRPYDSMDKWLKSVCPSSWSYCYQAWRSVKKLKELPVEDLLEIPRCNIVTMADKAPESVQKKPDVIEAAKTLDDAGFKAKLTNEYNLHIDPTVTLKIKLANGEMAEVEKALDWIGAQYDPPLTTRSSQLLAWAVDFNLDHQNDRTDS